MGANAQLQTAVFPCYPARSLRSAHTAAPPSFARGRCLYTNMNWYSARCVPNKVGIFDGHAWRRAAAQPSAARHGRSAPERVTGGARREPER